MKARSHSRNRLLAIHSVDGLVLAITAGILVLILQSTLGHLLTGLTGWLASVGWWMILGFTFFFFLLIAALLPKTLFSVANGFRRFKLHFGVIPKSLVGLATYVTLTSLHQYFTQGRISPVWPVILALVYFFLAGLASLWVAKLFMPPKRRKHRAKPSPRGKQDGKNPSSLDAWLADDMPICNEIENQIPEHSGVAERILDRLLTPDDHGKGSFPNVALIGPYGSGKTSICNLVEDRYLRQRTENNWPNMVFCRFEAWQYQTPHAAAKGLMKVASEAILEIADVFDVYALPDNYLDAIEQSAPSWTRPLTLLFRQDKDPQTVLSRIGDSLVRLNKRLLIFVDDFDRIEETLPKTQQAVSQALNQLQNVPNVQYVIAVGPRRQASLAPTAGKKPYSDLMKLTRYQELVPRLDPGDVLPRIRDLRDRCLDDEASCYPWATTRDGLDPLDWKPLYAGLGEILPASRLTVLLNTPRILKSVLRETASAWNGGLKGEINWYNLLFANAIRYAEPALFEWIERERELFLDPPSWHKEAEQKSEQAKQEIKRMNERVDECLVHNTPERHKVVVETLKELFPAFADRLNLTTVLSKRPGIHQSISFEFINQRSYLERFLSGRLSAEDIPDLPTLQYFHRIKENGFETIEFQSKYLSSHEQLTGAINKVTQFAGLLSIDLALEICNCILDWIAVPEHASVWPNPDDFVSDIMDVVYGIIANSDNAEHPDLEARRVRGEKKCKWLRESILRLGCGAPYVATVLLDFGKPSASGLSFISQEQFKELEELLAQRMREAFVDGNATFLPAIGNSLFSLFSFNRALQRHPDYAKFRSKYTKKLIAAANAESMGQLRAMTICSLADSIRSPIGGQKSVDKYSVSIGKDLNSKKYDMDLMIAALKAWKGKEFYDPLAEKVFKLFQKEYDLDT